MKGTFKVKGQWYSMRIIGLHLRCMYEANVLSEIIFVIRVAKTEYRKSILYPRNGNRITETHFRTLSLEKLVSKIVSVPSDWQIGLPKITSENYFWGAIHHYLSFATFKNQFK